MFYVEFCRMTLVIGATGVCLSIAMLTKCCAGRNRLLCSTLGAVTFIV